MRTIQKAGSVGNLSLCRLSPLNTPHAIGENEGPRIFTGGSEALGSGQNGRMKDRPIQRDPQDRQCPLCLEAEGEPFFEDRRSYFRCPLCRLVFVPPHQLPSAETEKAEYDKHQNSPDDPGYRRFLGRLFEPLVALLEPGSRGLDFGSGPGPTLSVMFEEAGYRMAIYDPFYAPDPSAFARRYDFVTASEVVEHLHRPRAELERLWSRLRPGGILGIMTKRVLDREAFSRWHYKNDPTHVCFFSVETFEWLAQHWRAELTVCGADVVLLARSPTASG